MKKIINGRTYFNGSIVRGFNYNIFRSYTKYFKITDNHGYQYKTGLNFFKKPTGINDDGEKGRLYFTDKDNIYRFFNYGDCLREVTLPTELPNFKMVNKIFDRYDANIINLGRKRKLSNVSTFKYLKLCGVDIYNDDIIRWASKKNHNNIMKFIVNKKSDNHKKNIALRCSIEHGNFEMVKYLIDQGVDINVDNGNIIHSALYYGRIETIKYLVEHGADVNINNGSIIKNALYRGHYEIVKHMIKYGADININNNDIIISAVTSRRLDVAKFLVEIGADIQACDNWILKWASEHGRLEVIKFLVEIGVDIQYDNNLAIRWSSFEGHLECVKFLVSQGADIQAQDNYAIRRASEYGRLEVVKFLVEKGADIQANNYYSIKQASKNGHMEVVKFLVSKMS
ncbi:ankyrin repeat protein [Cotonvirus japonicus]|uniref:Ankyrin repeat protein n=1 Tax=Cotonvirus japonicus TaxID=2811091 RepID=A0ABM7NSK4_9VIRU|nr:ankyrin repeat protein [Cotonvirus japonicus]BCS83144.1 ankyrin repeat protein [Cotonvirus japonicus]